MRKYVENLKDLRDEYEYGEQFQNKLNSRFKQNQNASPIGNNAYQFQYQLNDQNLQQLNKTLQSKPITGFIQKFLQNANVRGVILPVYFEKGNKKYDCYVNRHCLNPECVYDYSELAEYYVNSKKNINFKFICKTCYNLLQLLHFRKHPDLQVIVDQAWEMMNQDEIRVKDILITKGMQWHPVPLQIYEEESIIQEEEQAVIEQGNEFPQQQEQLQEQQIINETIPHLDENYILQQMKQLQQAKEQAEQIQKDKEQRERELQQMAIDLQMGTEEKDDDADQLSSLLHNLDVTSLNDQQDNSQDLMQPSHDEPLQQQQAENQKTIQKKEAPKKREEKVWSYRSKTKFLMFTHRYIQLYHFNDAEYEDYLQEYLNKVKSHSIKSSDKLLIKWKEKITQGPFHKLLTDDVVDKTMMGFFLKYLEHQDTLHRFKTNKRWLFIACHVLQYLPDEPPSKIKVAFLNGLDTISVDFAEVRQSCAFVGVAFKYDFRWLLAVYHRHLGLLEMVDFLNPELSGLSNQDLLVITKQVFSLSFSLDQELSMELQTKVKMFSFVTHYYQPVFLEAGLHVLSMLYKAYVNSEKRETCQTLGELRMLFPNDKERFKKKFLWLLFRFMKQSALISQLNTEQLQQVQDTVSSKVFHTKNEDIESLLKQLGPESDKTRQENEAAAAALKVQPLIAQQYDASKKARQTQQFQNNSQDQNYQREIKGNDAIDNLIKTQIQHQPFKTESNTMNKKTELYRKLHEQVSLTKDEFQELMDKMKMEVQKEIAQEKKAQIENANEEFQNKFIQAEQEQLQSKSKSKHKNIKTKEQIVLTKEELRDLLEKYTRQKLAEDSMQNQQNIDFLFQLQKSSHPDQFEKLMMSEQQHSRLQDSLLESAGLQSPNMIADLGTRANAYQNNQQEKQKKYMQNKKELVMKNLVQQPQILYDDQLNNSYHQGNGYQQTDILAARYQIQITRADANLLTNSYQITQKMLNFVLNYLREKQTFLYANNKNRYHSFFFEPQFYKELVMNDNYMLNYKAILPYIRQYTGKGNTIFDRFEQLIFLIENPSSLQLRLCVAILPNHKIYLYEFPNIQKSSSDAYNETKRELPYNNTILQNISKLLQHEYKRQMGIIINLSNWNMEYQDMSPFETISKRNFAILLALYMVVQGNYQIQIKNKEINDFRSMIVQLVQQIGITRNQPGELYNIEKMAL